MLIAVASTDGEMVNEHFGRASRFWIFDISKSQLILGLLLLIIFGPVNSNAGSAVNVGVAANFAPALELIGKRFTAETGIGVQLTISSSGQLFSQIRNQAPLDLYLSADTRRPEMLYEKGFCEEPVRYAVGKTVLWSRNTGLCALRQWQDVLNSAAVQRIAMANPQTAPYGTVALDSCRQLENWREIEKKLVYGSNVVQAFQYAATGVADASFIARSLALTDKAKGGCVWEVSGSAPVEQKACVVRHRPGKREASRLLEYITSEKTADIRQRLGYQ